MALSKGGCDTSPKRSFAVLQTLNSPARFETRQTCYMKMREQPIQDYQSCRANCQYIPENTEFIEALTLNIDTVSDIHYLSVNVPDANCQDI